MISGEKQIMLLFPDLTNRKQQLIIHLEKLITDVMNSSINLIPCCDKMTCLDRHGNECELYSDELASCDALSFLILHIQPADRFLQDEIPYIMFLATFINLAMDMSFYDLVNYPVEITSVISKINHENAYSYYFYAKWKETISSITALLIYLTDIHINLKREFNNDS